jgi:nocardicin N-oxygenase
MTADDLWDYPMGDTSRLSMDPRYDQARSSGSLVRVRMPYGGEWAWLATGHAEAKIAMSDPRFSRSASARANAPRLLPEPPPDGSVLTMDPPEHTRLRKLVAKAFTARRVEALRPRVQQIVDGLLDEMAAQGPPADLKKFLAEPLPITVICEVLGVPAADRQRFRGMTDAVMSVDFTSDDAQAAMGQFFGYLSELVASKREQPADDLLSAMVAARDADDQLDERELVWLGVALLIGGHETTLNQISNFSFLLLTHPDELHKLHERPDLVPQAIEELLRYVPLNTGSAFGVVAKEDVAFGDVVVRAGEAVIPDIAAANRDPRVFADPARLDLDRGDVPHVTFGFGAHHCIGAQLARLELQVVFSALLRRFPRLELALPEHEVPWRRGALIRGPEALPVTW